MDLGHELVRPIRVATATRADERFAFDDADRGLRMLVDELGSAGFEIVAEHRRATSAGA